MRRPSGGSSDRGSATVWSVGAIAVLCVVFGVVLALGQAVVVRHRAAGGADLAALAAADHWAEGGSAACARADRVARAQGVRLVRCEVAGQISDVTAASGRGPFTAEVRARAGPPGTSPGRPGPFPGRPGSSLGPPGPPGPSWAFPGRLGPALATPGPPRPPPGRPGPAQAPQGPSLGRHGPASAPPGPSPGSPALSQGLPAPVRGLPGTRAGPPPQPSPQPPR
jgi:secretion/DNA translocation related TadE-like protein